MIQGDDESLYEIIDGQRVDLPPRSILSNRVASNIHGRLFHHLISHPIGEAIVDTLIHLPLPADRNRRPDVAFVSAKAIGEASPQPGSDNAWDIVPDLVAEVVSPSDAADEVQDRLQDFFAAGTKLVWVVYHSHRLVYVYESPKKVCILDGTDDLEGGNVLPEFRVAVALLFPAEAT